MPTEQHHIIRRQYLEVRARGTEADGLTLQRRLPELCQDRVMPALDKVLQRAVPAEQHLTIEKLEIDAGLLTLENLERDLAGAVAQAFEKRLDRIMPPTDGVVAELFHPVQRRSRLQGIYDAFLHFL